MRAAAVGLVTLAVVVAAAILLLAAGSGPGARSGGTSAGGSALAASPGTASSPLAVDLEGSADVVTAPFDRDRMPGAGLLFDVDTGRVLWRHRPLDRRPIASLTKIMTALVVVDRTAPGDVVKITRFDTKATGSAVGGLPVGREIGVQTLLYGLMLSSGNDAARALARRAGGSYASFITEMNRLGRLLGLGCSRYSTANGLRDEGNFSCAADLAAQARALLRDRRLARIVATRDVNLPWPVKRGKRKRLELYNHNPLLLQGYRGVTGVKTGFTSKAGACFVVTARRGDVHLGVVLLDSPDIDNQARALLERGFRAEGVAPR